MKNLRYCELEVHARHTNHTDDLVSPSLHLRGVNLPRIEILTLSKHSQSHYFSPCALTATSEPPCCIFTPIISIITRSKAPSPSVCNIHSCGAGVWEKLGHNLFLVSSDSEYHQHHRRERRPQRQNDSVSACGLDHRLPRRHQRNRLLWEGSGEDG